ncbi:MAG: sigma factor-like helix-turn-helix DNA-binding protein [Phycisphaeraceae bacterium]
MLIKDMPVPNRPRRWLQVAGIRSVGDLLERSAADLLTIENFGQTSLEHVEVFLQRHGLELAEPQAEDLDETYVREGLRDRGCKLARREREILKLRYGIADGRQMTLEEVGRLFDLSRERVRQIQKQAEQKVIARRTFKAATRRTAAAAAR